MGETFVDVFSIKHVNCTVVDTINEFSRVFIIQDQNGSRFTCLKKDAPQNHKTHVHWKNATPEDAPNDYAIPYRNQHLF